MLNELESPCILLWSGSQRKESLNTKILHQLARYIPATFRFEWLDSAALDLPIFDPDLESLASSLHSSLKLHAQLSRCDAIVLASPEYNGQVTPYLKNTVDWVSRLPYKDASLVNVFMDKPVLLCSASPSWTGGSGGLIFARALLAYVGAMVLGDTISVPFADRCLRDDEFLAEGEMLERMSFSMSRLLMQADRFKAFRIY